jgi:tetratricopeptide (TPR) repeat protein
MLSKSIFPLFWTLFNVVILNINLATAQQDTVLYRNVLKGGDFLDKDKPDSAYIYLKQGVIDVPKSPQAWFLLAVCEEDLQNYKEAFVNINIALELSGNSAYVLQRRGLMNMNTFNYADAIADFSEVCKTKEEERPLCLYYRAVVYDYLGEYKKAKKDALEAEKLGAVKTDRQKRRFATLIEAKRPGNYHNITVLTEKSTDPDYGFTAEKPIKVGTGLDGAAQNEHTFLRRLLDAKGNLLKYNRKGSCCAYKSKYGYINNTALLDHYEIEFENEKGEKVKKDLYISMYDYETPKIPVGFSSVKPFR